MAFDDARHEAAFTCPLELEKMPQYLVRDNLYNVFGKQEMF
jgi:hypothetical protein